MIEPKRKAIKLSEQNTYPKEKSWEYEIDVYETSGTVNVDNKIVKVGKGFAPHGGIMLKNIYNQTYRMAYDIGVIGIYVFPNKAAQDNGHKTKFLVLGPPDFIQLDNEYNILQPDKELNPIVQTKEQKVSVGPFTASYPTGFDSLGFNMDTFNEDRESEINVKYRSNYEMFGKGSGYLIVEQKFIFTKYDDEPAHEPTGGLKAARLHPIIRLRFEKPQHETVKSFRVDYRLHLNLDTWATLQTIPVYRSVARVFDRVTKQSKINNAAGLFRDEDSTTTFDAVDDGVASIIFDAAEKPVVSEVITEGLRNSKTEKLWDNIHWWGIDNGGVLGSTPGSFHAIHMHWRWGKEVQKKYSKFRRKYDPSTPFHMGAEQLIGKGYEGELTDPAVFRQNLRLAVVKNRDSFYDYINKAQGKYRYNHQKFKFENEVFGNLFKNPTEEPNRKPKNISGGDDLVLYYSVEIKLKDCEGYKKDGILDGSFFVHGLFFAHEKEVESILTGTERKVYINPSKPNKELWERYPGQ